MLTEIDPASLAGRVLTMIDDALEQGRLSRTEAQVLHDLLWHPDFPQRLRSQESAPLVRDATGLNARLGSGRRLNA